MINPSQHFEWVASIVDPNELREFLHYVYVRDGIAWAADGKRIHEAPVTIAPGVYTPDGTLTNAAFFDFAKYMPPTDPRDGKALDLRQLEPYETTTGLTVANVEGRAYQTQYLHDAAGYGNVVTVWACDGQLRGVGRYGRFVIAEVR